jgi:hypothetical protein
MRAGEYSVRECMRLRENRNGVEGPARSSRNLPAGLYEPCTKVSTAKSRAEFGAL